MLSDDEIEQAVDAALMKLYRKTYREQDTLSAPAEGDSLAKILADFPEFFGEHN